MLKHMPSTQTGQAVMVLCHLALTQSQLKQLSPAVFKVCFYVNTCAPAIALVTAYSRQCCKAKVTSEGQEHSGEKRKCIVPYSMQITILMLNCAIGLSFVVSIFMLAVVMTKQYHQILNC